MTDPITNIEDEKAQVDMGVMSHRIYRGAVQDGANWLEAYLMVAAFWHGSFKANQEYKEGGGDS
jgi:hypothetical protein